MLRFRWMGTRQKFAAVHGSMYNHFDQQRHLTSGQIYKTNRAAARAEWEVLLA